MSVFSLIVHLDGNCKNYASNNGDRICAVVNLHTYNKRLKIKKMIESFTISYTHLLVSQIIVERLKKLLVFLGDLNRDFFEFENFSLAF